MFSDITVKTGISEAEVLEEAYGRKDKNKQAYCLIYLAESMFKNYKVENDNSLVEKYEKLINPDKKNSI